MIRLLILYDVDGWAYHSRALALRAHAPEDFSVEIQPGTQVHRADCDIVFNLDSSHLRLVGTMPHVLSWNADGNRRGERWCMVLGAADFVVCNNKHAWEFYGREERTCCISNGVDTKVFKVESPIEKRPDVVFWTGSGNRKKHKGYDILQAAEPLLREHGFTPDFHPVESAGTRKFGRLEMVKRYNRAGYVVCMSQSEGTPNTSLEGMACGCALVTTKVGNAMEFGEDGRNCVFVERSAEGLVQGLLKARENRVEIATAGVRTMREWSYEKRAPVFFDLFRRIVKGERVEPFGYDEVGITA